MDTIIEVNYDKIGEDTFPIAKDLNPLPFPVMKQYTKDNDYAKCKAEFDIQMAAYNEADLLLKRYTIKSMKCVSELIVSGHVLAFHPNTKYKAVLLDENSIMIDYTIK